jgi:hypothetical protein
MTKEVEIEVLKPFNRTPQGDLAEIGERFPVDETRADELARLGLAKATKAKAKMAPSPDNKMAPEPGNKARLPEKGRTPKAITSTMRPPVNEGVEAAAKVERQALRTIASEKL